LRNVLQVPAVSSKTQALAALGEQQQLERSARLPWHGRQGPGRAHRERFPGRHRHRLQQL